MKFRERDGDAADAKYFNTPATAPYFDRKSSRDIGGIPQMLNARLFNYWNDLPEALRTGKPQNETKHGGKIYSMNCMPTLKSLGAFWTG